MKRWLILIALIGVLVVAQRVMDRAPKESKFVPLQPPATVPSPGTATREPGRVVTLETSKGVIEFVLWEKDCPNTAGRVAQLVSQHAYDGIPWPRSEPGVIQTEQANKKVEGILVEPMNGLDNVPGAVGMARAQSPDTNFSAIYIMKESWPHLDQQYTVFGYVLNGMDVVQKIAQGDKIIKATLRPCTPADTEILKKANLQNPRPPAKKNKDA